MHTLVAVHHAGDAEVAQHQLLVLLVTEEKVARLDVLVDDVAVMAVGQGCGSLQGYTTELVEVAVKVVVVQRSSAQILHQLVVTALPVNICLAVVENLDYHLHAKALDDAQQGLLDGEVGVIDLQHHLPLLAGYQKDLGLSGIVAKTFNAMIDLTLQDKVLHIRIDRSGSPATGRPDSFPLSISSIRCHPKG